MSASESDIPTFDKNSLVDLGGWTVFREGKALVEAGGVKGVSWASPLLTGEVRVGGKAYFPRLNLRSRSFPEARCSCLKGQRGQVCEHVIALCMQSGLAEESRPDGALEARPTSPQSDGVVAPAPSAESFEIPLKNRATAQSRGTANVTAPAGSKGKRSGLKSLYISQSQGAVLALRILLPPNLQQAAVRDAIVVKVEARTESGIEPLERLDPKKPYCVASHDYLALALLEEWCGGRPTSIIQVSRERLRVFLDNFTNEPSVFFLNAPEQALVWNDDLEIAEVYRHLGVRVQTPDDQDSFSASGAYSAFGTPETEKNLLRESGAISASSGRRNRAEPRVDQGQLEVDGSPHFLAVRLPGRTHPNFSAASDLVKGEGFRNEPSNGRWWLRDEHKVLNFLAVHWGRLEHEWGAVFTPNFSKQMKKVKRAEIASEVIENRNGFTVSLSLKADGASVEAIRQNLSVGRHYVQTGKAIFLIDPELVAKLQAAQKALSGDVRSELSPVFSQSVNSAGLADAERILAPVCRDWRPPESWLERSGALREVSRLTPAPLPARLDDTLRSYQRIGVAWLYHLYRHELGGILADEMGLGKTIQALSLIESVHRSGEDRGPALVVCPASVVENWVRESRRFTPDLRVLAHHGAPRIKAVEELKDFDLIVTSYGTLARDIDVFGAIDFQLVIGDEAQQIKNRKTLNARSMRSLIARGRFLLTGTPIENSLDDLRALFDFLMPGYLVDRPSGIDADGRSWYDQRHRDQCAPYILRRSKKLVAPELPDKIEQVFYCHLDGAQAGLYEKVLKETQDSIMKLESGGANEGAVRMAAFTQLLRLRQVCADPRILDPDLPASTSSKLQAFREILSEALEDGHRILLFSQFVSVLKLVQQELDEQGLSYCYLDGQTRHRQREVDRFNGDDSIPVFLISLKAGGTGLNLTGADTVVHFDPWWNPAVEAQATDRAHRIGQKRIVTSIKLIAADTVEEQVVELQRTKAHMLAELLEASETANAKVSLSDIKGLLGLK